MKTAKAGVKRRLLTTGAALYLLALGGGIGYYVGAYTTATEESITADTAHIHYVEEGETLWDIARPLADAKDKDIREIIYQIEVNNDLGISPTLSPGQKLVIRY